jgi:hypothetical protein
LIDELRTAQNVLNDPERRAAYDATLPASQQPRQPLTAPSPAPMPAVLPANDAGHAYPPGAPAAAQRASAGYNYADPMAPVGMPSGVGPGAALPTAAPAYAPLSPYASPGVPLARPVGVPMAVPVKPMHVAYHVPPGAAQPAPYTASPIAPSSAAQHGFSPAPSPLPAPVKIRRRRGSFFQNAIVIGVAGVMLALVVFALNAGLKRSAKEESARPGPVAQRSNPAQNNERRPTPSSRARPSFIPTSKTELPPLTDDAPPTVAAPPTADQPEMTSDPGPEPAVSPAPSPVPEPAPAREPTDAEIVQTQEATRAALAALRSQDFDGADSSLKQVESLPKMPDDEKKFAGAQQLAAAARNFGEALQKGFAGLKADQEIRFNNSTVKVKEASPENITIEVVAGVTKKYTPGNLPLGLKYGLINTVIAPDDPANPLAKAAWHATHPDGDPAEARHFLEAAQAAGADVEGALALLDEAAPPATTIAAAPEPAPTPTTVTTPEPDPEPSPASAPEAPTPPTARELEELTKLAQTARTALEERNLDEADELIAKAEPLARLPEHQEKIAHLKQLAHFTREFWKAVDESLKTLSSMGELTVGETVVSVVESRPNHLVIKVAGQVKRYTRRDMPGGLAMAIANLWFNEGDAAAKAARGALYAVEKKGDPGKARDLWQEAAQMGLDTTALLLTLDEDFDFRSAMTSPSGSTGVTAKSFDIRVSSKTVKHVAGKHRYFFDIRNYDSKPFDGEVSITLVNNQPGITNGEESFQTTSPIPPNLGRSVFLEVNTGPVAVHGDSGVARFQFKAMLRDRIVSSGEGVISEEYEDLTE